MTAGESYFAIDVVEEDASFVLRARGELDAVVSVMLASKLRELGSEKQVYIDLSEVSFIDSSGLSVITAARRDAEDAGGVLQVRGTSEAVARVFEITGLGSLIDG